MWLKIRSRNASAKKLQKQIRVDTPTVLRLGSKTPNEEIFKPKHLIRGIREINTVEACMISNDKKRMKEAFNALQVPTAPWCTTTELSEDLQRLHFPVIIKHIHSSQGDDIYYCSNVEEFQDWLNERHGTNHIVEEYKTYSREYRIHVTKNGCFLANRKMLRNDAEVRWHRHHSNSVWINEDNPMFDRPTNWDEIVDACKLALLSIGLEIGAVDVKVQNNQHEHPQFIILETNSAPALGDETAELYKNELINLINE